MTHHIERQIEHLKERILRVGTLVEEAISKSITALINRDTHLAQRVMASDEDIDRMEVEVEEECLKILALYQPVAADLRFVVSVLKINNDLERMGDLAVHIAKVARLRYPESAIPAELRGTLLEMGQIAELVIQKAGSALVARDGSLFDEIEREDDRMDNLHRKLFTLLLDDGWAHGVEAAIDVTLISRYYERFADHAVSVARRVANDF